MTNIKCRIVIHLWAPGDTNQWAPKVKEYRTSLRLPYPQNRTVIIPNYITICCYTYLTHEQSQ